MTPEVHHRGTPWHLGEQCRISSWVPVAADLLSRLLARGWMAEQGRPVLRAGLAAGHRSVTKRLQEELKSGRQGE